MRICRTVLLGSMLLALGGCSTSLHQKGKPSINDIQKTMHQAEMDNRKAKASVATSLPQSVANGLLPTMGFGQAQKDTKSSERFDVSVKDMPAAQFFAGLVKGTKFNMMVSPKVEGSVTLDLRNVTIPDVLNAVHSIYGYDYKVTSYGYQVFPAQLQTRMFTVNYLNVNRKGTSTTSISSGQFSASHDKDNNSGTSSSGSSTASSTSSSGSSSSSSDVLQPASSVVTDTQSDFWMTLKGTLGVIIGNEKGHRVIVNPGAGLVIVKATPAELNQVANYLDQLQSTMTRQVIIDAKIMEVTLNKGFQAGINWKVLGFETSGADGVTGTTGNPLAAALGTFGNVLTLGMSSGADFRSVIKALSSQGNVQVLSSPRIATLNNQKAVIKVGTDQFYITDVNSDTTGSGTDTTTSSGFQLTPFFSGIALGVTPQISADGAVTLHIHPVVSDVISDPQNITISGKNDQFPLAKSTVRESDSIVHAKDGQVVVIGGLMESKTEENIASVPFLGKIPFLGAAFRRTQQKSVKTELIILLRPIVVNNQSTAQVLATTENHINELNRGFHFGSHPETFGNMAETRYFRQNKIQKH